MPTLNTTPNQGYQLPFGGNDLSVDVARIISAISAIDVDIANALAALASKAGLASPALTGTPTAPTAAPGTNTGQLATTAFVKAALDALIGGAPAALDTLNELAAALADDAEFAATIAAAIALKADISSVVRHDEAQALTIAQQYQARTNIGAGFGFENRLINPFHRVDIEGNSGGINLASGAGRHIVEGWVGAHISDTTTLRGSRVAGDSVPYALQLEVTAGPDASLGAAQAAWLDTAIEGYDVADAQWGTANAKPVYIAGRMRAPTTGVYCIAVVNEGNSRRYVFEINCVANTWVDFEKEVPGDTGGTWNKTSGIGIRLQITMATGTDYQAPADAWGTGYALGTANQENGLAGLNNILRIENLRVSVAKPVKTEWRPYDIDFSICSRYYEKSSSYECFWSGYTAASFAYYYGVGFRHAKRAVPAVSTVITSASGFPLNNPSVSSSVGFHGFYALLVANSTYNSSYFYFGYTASARLIA